MPEQSERQYNLFWMIRMSPFAEYSDEQIQEAIEKKVREVNRTLKTQPVEMVRVKSERKVAKLESLSGNKEAIEAERDQAILHFNRNMIEDNNGEVPTDAAKIDATVAREGWADGTGLVKVDGMPHCPKCGYMGRRHRTGQGRRHAPLPQVRLHQQEDQALRELRIQAEGLNNRL